MTTRHLSIIAALAALLVGSIASGSAIAQAYKYTNEDGEVVYSDSPPPAGRAAEQIKLESAPPAQATDPEGVREEARQYLEEGSSQRESAQAQRSQKKAARAASKQQCETARMRLQELTTGPPNRRLVQDPDGTPRRVSADEMKARIERARADVGAACGSN